MKCPGCGSETKVVDKRITEDSSTNRRRRECLKCGKRFTTYEKLDETGVEPTKIRKRNGQVVNFDPEKITNAIFSAAKAVGGKDKALAEQLSAKVIEKIKSKFKDTVPSVEDVQDAVEKVLIENGRAKTAKAYILYREQHKKIRETWFT